MGSGDLELIFDRVGHFGRFQIFLYVVCAFQNTSCGIHYLASVFMTATPHYVCKPPGNVSMVLFHQDTTLGLEDIWALFSPGQEDHIALQLQNGTIWELTGCHMYWRENAVHLEYDYHGSKHEFPCSGGYIYDWRKWESTVVTEWNLVCHQEWLAKMIQPTFMLGVLLGAVIFGYLSDRAGRRLILRCTSIGQFFLGIAVAFTLDYYSFMVTHFLLAMVASGYLVVMFVYVTEFIGMKARTWASIHVHSFFAIGIMVVALVGYLVKTWRLYQIVLSVVSAPFALCCWMLPETPFWLLSQARYEEAQKIVDKMAKWNRASSCTLSELLSLDHNGPADNNLPKGKKPNISDLFCDWNIAIRTLCIWLIWFTGSLGFYFFSLNSVNLGGSEYLNLFLMGAAELPAYVFVCIGMDKIGRRKVLTLSLISSAVICGVIMGIPQGYHIWSVVASMVGKFTMAAAFGLIYLYTAELYPTIVRSQAVGSGSMMCCVGSIVAPFCIYLTSVWRFLPQLLVGTVAFLSGGLTLLLPETLGKPLVTTWEEAAKLESGKLSSCRKLLHTTNNIELEKTDVINPETSGLCE
ncbi:solute carrier family 22 member 16 [Dasypus novemcinctus]|uniref:solute carrier family 22 member 16 n=1 Tax=Dasypus novemcinctus TaxID=9361 RepID=UPI00265E2C1E|nr:solute carrier family 22 member 16 [Dasypus novemcinctus]